MPTIRTLEIGTITDEVSRNLSEAIEISMGWGLRLFELREGSQARFPNFTPDEIRTCEAAIEAGARITAISPGMLKGNAADASKIRQEMAKTLPHSLELAQRFGCDKLIVFGFEKDKDEPSGNRLFAMKAFEEVAEQAAQAGITVVIENEPNFWLDMPADAAQMLREIGHPSLKLNWDPGNMAWGGVKEITHEHFEAVLPFMANLHVKDYYPQDPQHPWRPVGMGITNWQEILTWVLEESELPHVTLEVHATPLMESTKATLDAVRKIIGQ